MILSKNGQDSRFVMAGSMDSFNTPFVLLFDLAVHITADTETRLARIRKREFEALGDRIMPGGDMYAEHHRFLSFSPQQLMYWPASG